MKNKIIIFGIIALVVFSTLVSAWQEYLIRAPGDNLAMGESIADVRAFLGPQQLDMLRGGSLWNPLGHYRYSQRLEFDEGVVNSPRLTFGENREDEVADYLLFNGNDYFLNYNLRFSPAFKSRLDEDLIAYDYIAKTVNMLGSDWQVIFAGYASNTTNDTLFKLRMMTGPFSEGLHEGETVVLSMDGEDYEITVVYLTQDCAKFSVNGELTSCIERYDFELVQGDIPLLVRSITPQQQFVKFRFGGQVLDFMDDYSDDEYFMGVRVNDELVDDARVRFTAERNGGFFEISDLDYMIKADLIGGGTDIYLGEGQRLSELLDDPEALFGGSWDFEYRGLTRGRINSVRFDLHGDDQYNIEFTNTEGRMYDIPYISTSPFKYGTSDEFLWFTESDHHADYFVEEDDYFILSPASAPNASRPTRVYTYDAIDTVNKLLYFTEQASGPIAVSYWGEPGVNASADIIMAGYAFKVNIGPEASGYKLALDMNGDGNFWGTSIPITVSGNAEMSLGPGGGYIQGNTTYVYWQTYADAIEEQEENETLVFRFDNLGTALDLDVTYGAVFYEVEGLDEAWAMTEYTSLLRLVHGDELVVEQPSRQRFGKVFVLGASDDAPTHHSLAETI